MISLTLDGIRVPSSIGISVPTKNFDKVDQLMKRNSTGSAEINNKLNKLKTEIGEYYFTLLGTNKTVEKELISNKLHELLCKKVEDKLSQLEETEKPKKKLKMSDILKHFMKLIKKTILVICH